MSHLEDLSEDELRSLCEQTLALKIRRDRIAAAVPGVLNDAEEVPARDLTLDDAREILSRVDRDFATFESHLGLSP